MPIPTVFFGGRTNDGLFQSESGFTDDGEPYPYHARTDRAAPAGVGGECAFYALYLSVAHEADIALTVTPIIDGVALEATVVNFAGDGVTRKVEQVEIPLSVPYVVNGVEQTRVAPRGTWIEAEVHADNPGALVLSDAVVVEYDVVRESLVAEVPR